MDCVESGHPNYDSSRRISNSRFDYRPFRICYCERDEDVRAVIKMARPGGLRIRSGGHQHEAMCSGKDVLIVDVSKLNDISILNGGLMEVGAGTRLGDLYNALWCHRRLLPGGGCADVRISGLVQGGGWGPYARAMGLTCDRLESFRIVTADGMLLDVDKNGPDKELFWAVCGGGGGNFGVVTKFRFHLGPLDGPITSFAIEWENPGLTATVLNDWGTHAVYHPETRLTSFCRLTTRLGGSSADKPTVVGGNYLGDQLTLEALLPELLPATYSLKSRVAFARVDRISPPGGEEFQHPDYQPGPPEEALIQLAAHRPPARGRLDSTCTGTPFPHKVSSGYPKINFGVAAVNRLAQYMIDSKPEPTARRYVTFHCFGGAIANPNPFSCFAFRNKPFLLQYQAWWANKEQKDVEARCIKWVQQLREAMQEFTEYAFINFVDRDLPAKTRKELLAHYYGPQALARLIRVKSRYDRNNVFDFEMSIPTS